MKKRRKLYDWQEDVIRSGFKPANAIKEMDQLVKDYNACVRKAVKKVYYKYAFTIAGITLAGLAGSLVHPLASASALLAIIQFATLDKNPVINAGESEPAAMFHDIKKEIG